MIEVITPLTVAVMSVFWFWTGVLYEKKFGKSNDSVMEFLD